MLKTLPIILMTLSFSLYAQTNQDRLDQLQNLKKIAFGSCNNQNDEQPLWKDMIKQRPDLFIWGGDNIYADWGKSDSVERAYRKQNAHPDYAKFKTLTPMIGTWDDHDYAYNEAGGDNTFKKESQKLFLDFFDVPTDSPRREQEGIYHSFEANSEGQTIKFILLDNRYFKGLEPNAPLLGETQWQWLENEFKNSTASLHVIVTGLSIFSPLLPYTEEWWQYPVEVNRMLSLLKTHHVKAPLFITGDKHFSSIFKRSGQLEFLSSGLTHTADRRTWWYLGRKYPTTYFGLSYGMMEIAWEKDIPKLTLYIRNGSKEIHKTKVIWKKDTWQFLR